MQFERRRLQAASLPEALATPDAPDALCCLIDGDQMTAYLRPELLRGRDPQAMFKVPIQVGGFKDSMTIQCPAVVGVVGDAPETEFFAGKRCVVAIRNDERPAILREWLEHLVQHHGLEAALILDRAEPAKADRDSLQIEAEIAGSKTLRDLKVMMLSADVPLGHPELGHEAHPMNAPDAPGKDRMDHPEADPWHSPILFGSFYEFARQMYLERARCVLALDPLDLLPAPDGRHPNVFDAAEAQPGTYVQLVGHRAYPWAIRPNALPEFADHICLRFDEGAGHGRWCYAPLPDQAAVWRWRRVVGVPARQDLIRFYRCMALRYGEETGGGQQVSRLVPKSSLVESDFLLNIAEAAGHKPRRLPDAQTRKDNQRRNDVAIVTTMKNEGPFILEWLAYHRVIGVEKFLVFTNDCTDGTDTFFDLLQRKGIVEHRENPFREMDLKPQHAALAAAEKEPIMKNAAWCICMDVDEYINVHVGDGTLGALFKALPDANMISLTWRLYGNADVHEFDPSPIIGQFDRCAPEMARKPHQAWGFKTLFRNIGLFKKMGVHRPKGLKPQLVDQINWVNGSGKPMPEKEYRTAWRSTASTVGYAMVSLNHYAVRSAESFLVKRDRGRVNHVDRDQGLAYWFRMNNNYEENRSIMRMIPRVEAEMARLLEDPEIRAAHEHCIAEHRAHIDRLMATENYRKFYGDITGERMERLSRMHLHFGSAVFHTGPDCVPDEVVFKDQPADFFFTVEEMEGEQEF